MALRTTLVVAVALCTLAASATTSTASGGGWHGHKRCQGVATAHHSKPPASVTIGANWTLTTPSGAPATVAGTFDQVELATFEINSSCGLRIGSSKHSKKLAGTKLAIAMRDNATTAATSAALTHELITKARSRWSAAADRSPALRRRRRLSSGTFRSAPISRRRMRSAAARPPSSRIRR